MTVTTVPRMTRATWYKHRFSAVGTPAVFLLAALALFADSAVQRHWLSVHHLNGCLVASADTGGSWCQNAAWAAFVSQSQNTNVMAAAVLALPVLAGLFAGAAAYWWYQIAQWQTDTSIWSWRWSSFELTPLSIAGWTVLAMALALLCGVLIRRMLAAMAVFLVAIGACAYVSQTWLRSWLFSIGQAVKNTSAGLPPSTTTYTVRTWLGTASGQRVSGPPALANANAWIAQRHYTFWVAYQPHSHLIWLALARNGILVAVAALAVLASAWWLRIRPAD